MQAIDVGRTLTRFNFPQAEAFNPLGILLARHLTQLDEAQRTAAEEAEDHEFVDDRLRPEVADAILAAALPRGLPLGQEALYGGEQDDESGGAGDGVFVRNFRSRNPVFLPDDIPIDSIRVDFTTGDMRVTTESAVTVTFPNEGSSGTQEVQPPVANAGPEDQAEVETLTPPEILPEGKAIMPITRSGRLTCFRNV